MSLRPSCLNLKLFCVLIVLISILVSTACSVHNKGGKQCSTQPIVIDCSQQQQYFETCFCPDEDIVWVEKSTTGSEPASNPPEFLIKFTKKTPLKFNGHDHNEVFSTHGKTNPEKAHGKNKEAKYRYDYFCTGTGQKADPMVKVPPRARADQPPPQCSN
jgi:hypothetical protein